MPYLMINGVKQEFETFGDIHNPPLILLYGGGTNQPTWRIWEYKDMLARLAEENYVIAYDRRGHGSSRFPAGTTLEDVAKDVFTLMDLLCIEKANMLGYSAGTYVLGCAAGIAPERINSLILVAANSHSFGGSPATHVMRERGFDLAKATPEQTRAMTRVSYAPETPDSVIDGFDEWTKPLKARYPALPREDSIAAYQAIANFDNRENFKKLKAPTLVLAGKYDAPCPPEVGKEIADSIESSQYVLCEHSGHMMLYEESEKCISSIIEFLRTVR